MTARTAALAALVLGGIAAPAAASRPAADPETLTVGLAVTESLTEVAVSFGIPAPGVDDGRTGDDWDWVDDALDGEDDGEKAAWKAVALSAAVPGLGERWLGSPRRATLFHVTEAAIWSTFAFFRVQGELRQDRHIEFAAVNAGAPGDQDSDYYEHIGFWLSLEEWHDIVRRDARFRFPDDPAAQQAFFEQNLRYDQGQAWAWDDDAARTRYRQLRSKSERSFRNARLAAGAAIFNRLASMVDALALSRRRGREIREDRARLELRIGPLETGAGLAIGPVLTRRY